MQFQLDKVSHFHCPRWDELPEEPLFNRELVAYINEIFEPIMFVTDPLTTTMVQNYNKWGLLPEITGRKYTKDHVALLITLTIFKSILNIDVVRKGMRLQLQLMPIEVGYNSFAQALEDALQRTFIPVSKGKALVFREQPVYPGTEGLQAVANAYAMKCLSQVIINHSGYERLGEIV